MIFSGRNGMHKVFPWYSSGIYVPVIDIAIGKVERQYFALIIDNQKELKAIKPANGALSSFCGIPQTPNGYGSACYGTL